jgi:hypothetical protein
LGVDHFSDPLDGDAAGGDVSPWDVVRASCAGGVEGASDDAAGALNISVDFNLQIKRLGWIGWERLALPQRGPKVSVLDLDGLAL